MNGTRAFWLRQLHTWHWVSAAVSLLGMLLFAATGLTLNNAAWFKTQAVTQERELALPPPLRQALSELPREGRIAVPPALAGWAARQFGIELAGRETEASADELYIALPGPGHDSWLAIDRAEGWAVYRQTRMGWLAFLNDLHKGRHAGVAWSWFIDVMAVACIVFSLTGLGLLYLHGRGRPMTWPLASLGLVVPLVLVLLFIH